MAILGKLNSRFCQSVNRLKQTAFFGCLDETHQSIVNDGSPKKKGPKFQPYNIQRGYSFYCDFSGPKLEAVLNCPVGLDLDLGLLVLFW